MTAVSYYSIKHLYHVPQKLSKRKLKQFTGFYPSVGQTFTVFASSVWKVLKTAIAK